MMTIPLAASNSTITLKYTYCFWTFSLPDRRW